MTAKTFVKKKTNENVKEELLDSLREKEEDEETKINTVNNATEALEQINHYEEMIRTQGKWLIQYICKQGEIIKMLKEIESFFDNAGHSRSTLPSSYFRSNLNTIKSVCKKYRSLFSRKIANKND